MRFRLSITISRNNAKQVGDMPGGPNQAVQFNDAGVLNGVAEFLYDKDTDTLTVAGLELTPTGATYPIDYTWINSFGSTINWLGNEWRFFGHELNLEVDSNPSGFTIRNGGGRSALWWINNNGSGANPFFSNVPDGYGVNYAANTIDGNPIPAYFGCLPTGLASFGFDTACNFILFGVTCDRSKTVVVPTTGFNTTLAAHKTFFNPAGTLATGTVSLPAAPVDGQEHVFTFSQIVTALTISGNGNTIAGALSTAALGQRFAFTFDTATTTWYPS